MEIHQSQESSDINKPPTLPVEIILHIISIVRRTNGAQSTLWACTLISSSWYGPAVEALYRHPRLNGQNFKLFTRTICPSVNSHVKKIDLSSMVKWLDMSQLVYDSTKSLTARLLGRCKESLEFFIAPQVSFAVNCLAALSKARNLSGLDLSGISVALPLPGFFNAICKLDNLRVLHFPGLFTSDYSINAPSWPANLDSLHIGGIITDDVLPYLSNFPSSLKTLNIHGCYRASKAFMPTLIKNLFPQLQELIMISEIDGVDSNTFDGILLHMPFLRRLSIMTEYLDTDFFSKSPKPNSSDHALTSSSLLEELELHFVKPVSFHIWQEGAYTPQSLTDGVLQGSLNHLRRVWVHDDGIWTFDRGYACLWEQLGVHLRALAQAQGEEMVSDEKVNVGVWKVKQEGVPWMYQV